MVRTRLREAAAGPGTGRAVGPPVGRRGARGPTGVRLGSPRAAHDGGKTARDISDGMPAGDGTRRRTADRACGRPAAAPGRPARKGARGPPPRLAWRRWIRVSTRSAPGLRRAGSILAGQRETEGQRPTRMVQVRRIRVHVGDDHPRAPPPRAKHAASTVPGPARAPAAHAGRPGHGAERAASAPNGLPALRHGPPSRRGHGPGGLGPEVRLRPHPRAPALPPRSGLAWPASIMSAPRTVDDSDSRRRTCD